MFSIEPQFLSIHTPLIFAVKEIMKIATQKRLLRAACPVLAVALGLLTSRAVMFRGPILPPEPLPAEPLLDAHCHVAGIGAGNSGCFVSARLRRSWKLRFYLRAFGVSRRDLREQGDAVCGQRLSTALAASRQVRSAVVLAID